MKKYKLIAVDLDGTLLNNQKQISNDTKEDIISAHNNGVQFVIATGRSLPAARQFFTQFNFNIPLILYNGSTIRMSEDLELIYNKTFQNQLAQNIFDVINKNDGTCCFWTNDTLYFNKENVYSDYYHKITTIKPNIISDVSKIELTDINKFIWFDEPEELEKIKKDILAQIDGINYFKSHSQMLEIVPLGISKGNAVSYLADKLNISKDEIICIGDDENDLSMIKYAGLGVAMGNAKDMIKQQADYITDTNEKNGVGKVINEFIL